MTSATRTVADVVVVGAGLAGLVAARTLQGAGARVVVVDKGRGPGGRMATRRLVVGERGVTGVADHGAQFFTVRSPAFGAMVGTWPVRVWHHGPARAGSVTDAPSTLRSGDDGHPRYVGLDGMNGIAKHLAAGLDVRSDHRVTGIRPDGGGWRADLHAHASLRAPRMVLTAPVPQTIGLLDGCVELPPAVTDIAYDPCLALLAVLDAPPAFAAHRAVQFDTGPVHHLADNATKGISAAPVITAHASGAMSEEWFDAEDEGTIRRLWDLVSPWAGAPLLTAQLKRWRYATPTTLHPERAVAVAEGMVLAGDAFGGPKVEGAVRSGLAAAAIIRA